MILGIESSCDDSSIAIIKRNNLELVFHKKISQELEHSIYGGVVPELAARLHTKALPSLLNDIKPYFSRIKAISVTNEPGLSVSLISGVSMAKALSISLKIPLISVNHLIGHIYSLFLNTDIRLPLGVLLVSGGHTLILNIDKNLQIKTLATTSDDSFGESFDKVAKMMGLGYPGGAVISKLASKSTNKNRFKFPIPLINDKQRLEYSFSGLKNAVRVCIENIKDSHELTQDDKEDIAYSFEQSACLHIMDKLKMVFSEQKFNLFGVVGGASANPVLRAKIEKLCKDNGCELILAPLEFCSDNAAMIARAGVEKYKKRDFVSYKELKISPRSSELKL